MGITQILNKEKAVNRFAENGFPNYPGFETTLVRQNLAFLEPMIFGLLTREWITDQDKEFLDLLAPSHCISFLIYDDKYLNPEDLALFPHELIENTLAQNSPAVFSHIFRPENNNISQNYKIETAIINIDTEKSIVFGFFGPEEILAEQSHCHDFHTIITRFRQAYQTAGKMLERIQQKCNPDSNMVAVNRASGRIIYISDNMLTELNKLDREVIGLEYNQFKKMLHTTPLTGKLKLQNINIDDFMVATMAVSPAPKKEQLKSNTINFIKTELEKTILKTKRRFEIYDHLFINSPENDKRVLRETSEKLTNNLNMQSRHLGAVSKVKVNLQKVNLLYEFDQAVSACSKTLGFAIEPVIDCMANDLYTETDPELARTLFESILLSHYLDYPVLRSSLKFSNNKEIQFILTTELDKTDSEIIITDRMKFTENISALSGFNLQIKINNQQIITRLTLDKIER